MSICSLFVILCMLRSVAANNEAEEMQIFQAVCNLPAVEGRPSGRITFRQGNSLQTIISYDIRGLSQGDHGMHVHAKAPRNNDCGSSSTGGHFNPFGTLHGSPTSGASNRHFGDLGNITASADGRATGEVSFFFLSLVANPQVPAGIVGKSIVVHAKRDDGNPTRDPTSTGDAGGRLACCEIVGRRLV